MAIGETVRMSQRQRRHRAYRRLEEKLTRFVTYAARKLAPDDEAEAEDLAQEGLFAAWRIEPDTMLKANDRFAFARAVAWRRMEHCARRRYTLLERRMIRLHSRVF